MQTFLLMFPDRSIPFLRRPSVAQVAEVLENPKKFGDIGEAGALELLWAEEINFETDNVRVIDFNHIPPSSSLRFYLGIPNFSIVFYSDTRLNIFQKVIGNGRHFENEYFFVNDCGGCELELNKSDLLDCFEARNYISEFIQNYGMISVF